MLDIDMADVAQDERFALACSHGLYPVRFLGPPRPLQVLERTNVVHLDALM